MKKEENIPEIIDSPIKMSEPNEQIIIYSGQFEIKQDANNCKVNGQIFYNWLPNAGPHFSGNISIENLKMLDTIENKERFNIIVDGLQFGEGIITLSQIKNSTNDIYVEGLVIGPAILGDKTIAVSSVLFSIPNLRDLIGLPVQKTTETNITCSLGRFIFENDEYVITIDKSYKFKEQKSLLNSKGGCLILYAGELKSKKQSIILEEVMDTFHCLNKFLSFLNGRRTAALFTHGYHKNSLVWSDYSRYIVDNFKSVQTWPQMHSIDGLNELWKEFSKIWKDENDKYFLSSVIHWYVEANGNSGFIEGSIIMAQTALELIYNWWLIENKKLIIGKDTDNISTSNKLRLLLSQLNIPYSPPTSFAHLQTLIKNNQDINDAPEAFVQIRNAIVHSQEEKRKKLSNIHALTKLEALQTSLWYIEMSLLSIFKFKGMYLNRCSGEKWNAMAEEYVPWEANK